MEFLAKKQIGKIQKVPEANPTQPTETTVHIHYRQTCDHGHPLSPTYPGKQSENGPLCGGSVLFVG